MIKNKSKRFLTFATFACVALSTTLDENLFAFLGISLRDFRHLSSGRNGVVETDEIGKEIVQSELGWDSMRSEC